MVWLSVRNNKELGLFEFYNRVFAFLSAIIKLGFYENFNRVFAFLSAIIQLSLIECNNTAWPY